MTTYDRYLLRRFLSVFAIIFTSTFGLYVVIDGFTNLDEFQQTGEGSNRTLWRMAVYYSLQTTVFFEMVGLILCVISVMVVLALVQKSSELNPILAAGIPTYRLAVPFIAATLLITVTLLINQELVIPSLAHRLSAGRHEGNEKGYKVQPVYDYHSNIHIDGDLVFVSRAQLEGARIALPPGIANELTTLKADAAVYHKPGDRRPAGWLLRDVSPPFDVESLSPAGRLIVVPRPNSKDVFVVTDVTPDRLWNRGKGNSLMSTADLVSRIRNPAMGVVSVRSQTLNVHTRLTRPLSALLMVFVVVPLVIRRESRSVIGNMAICSGTLAGIYGLAQVCQNLGGALVSPDLAVWTPMIFSGGLAAWLTGSVQS